MTPGGCDAVFRIDQDVYGDLQCVFINCKMPYVHEGPHSSSLQDVDGAFLLEVKWAKDTGTATISPAHDRRSGKVKRHE